MAKHAIHYDLMKGKDYKKLTDELTRLGACRFLLSAWMLNSESSCAQIRDHLTGFVDADDRLVVQGLTGEAAWTTTLTSTEYACLRR